MCVGSRRRQMPYVAPNGLRFSSLPRPPVRVSGLPRECGCTLRAPTDLSSRSATQRSWRRIVTEAARATSEVDLCNAGEQPRPVRLEIAQSGNRRGDAARMPPRKSSRRSRRSPPWTSRMRTPSLMLIGSMMNAATSLRFSRCSMRRSAVASSGGAILPQCGSTFLMCSRLSEAPMLNPQASCRGSCLRATARRGGRYGSARPAARGRPPRIHRSRGSRSSADGGQRREQPRELRPRRIRVPGIDVIRPLEAFDRFRDRRRAPPKIPDAPAQDEVDVLPAARVRENAAVRRGNLQLSLGIDLLGSSRNWRKLLHFVRDSSTGFDQIRQQPFIYIDSSFVLRPIPSVVGLRQDSPDVRAQAKSVRQHLKNDVALRWPESVMPERRQAECVSGAVGEIEPTVEGVRFALRVLQPRQAGTHEARKLVRIGSLLCEDVSRAGEALKWRR